MRGSARTSITGRRELEQDWEHPREFRGGGGVVSGQSDGGLSSTGSTQGRRNKWVPVSVVISCSAFFCVVQRARQVQHGLV